MNVPQNQKNDKLVLLPDMLVDIYDSFTVDAFNKKRRDDAAENLSCKHQCLLLMYRNFH